ncbi:MAG: cysteine synthase A [candidate division Zixibacteria bacterium]|nr:cysteine synthase A [candidate division Zixibacteria bacterium]
MVKIMRFNSIIETIGRTPLVKMQNLAREVRGAVYGKLEFFNPAGSVKDRIALSMVEAAEKEGKLKPGMTIVEPTSGNTGIGLAMVAAAKGYEAIFVMPESMSVERRSLLKQYGAGIVLTPREEGMKGSIAKAEEISSGDGYFQPFQFSNPANPAVHGETTAREIIDDLGDTKLSAFVAGVGTGGTISGAGEVLKKEYGCRIIAVEPEASPVLSGGEPGSHKIQGIGAGFIPGNFNPDVVDEIIKVSDEKAFETSRTLARQEGILAGISSGANAWAALRVAEKFGNDATVVFIVCDTGERYLSTPLFEQSS